MNLRVKKLQKIIKSENLDGFISLNPSNIFYLTGFQAEGSIVFVSPKDILLVVPQLLYLSAKELVDCKVVVAKSIKDFFNKYKVKKIGFEETASYRQYQRLKKIEKLEVKSFSNLVENIRSVKDQDEISKIKYACKITTKAVEFADSIIKAGMTEKHLADRLEYFLRANGAEKSSFDIIVAFEENSAKPHHVPTDRKLKKDDAIVIDMGCIYNGYCSDLTRTLFLSKIDGYKRKVFNIVKEAKDCAIDVIKSGISCEKVDFAARSYIKNKGFGKYFIHSTGHGVGIDVHEEPIISANSETVLKEGMVVTIEPGIYIPNKFGVRIEDVILVKKTGCEVITR